jgi:hypothetical protein
LDILHADTVGANLITLLELEVIFSKLFDCIIILLQGQSTNIQFRFEYIVFAVIDIFSPPHEYIG